MRRNISRLGLSATVRTRIAVAVLGGLLATLTACGSDASGPYSDYAPGHCKYLSLRDALIALDVPHFSSAAPPDPLCGDFLITTSDEHAKQARAYGISFTTGDGPDEQCQAAPQFQLNSDGIHSSGAVKYCGITYSSPKALLVKVFLGAELLEMDVIELPNDKNSFDLPLSELEQRSLKLAEFVKVHAR